MWSAAFNIAEKMEPFGAHALLTAVVLSMIDVLNSSPHPKPIVNGFAAERSETRRLSDEGKVS